MLLKNLEYRNTDKTKRVDLISLEKIIPVVNNLSSKTWILDDKHIVSKLRGL